MVDLLRDNLLDVQRSDAPPTTTARWHGCTVEVRARLVPCHLWTTTSIDVFLDGRCIIRTGGEWTIAGSRSAEFHHDDAVHTVELSWGRVQPRGFARRCFPYQLRIDGTELPASKVAVENSWLVVIPYLAVALYFLLRNLVAIL